MSENDDIYFITHRQGKQCKQQTEEWLFGHGITMPTVLIAGDDKTPLIHGLGLNFYCDDKWSTLYRGASALANTEFYCIDAPYNREPDMFGIKRVESVIKALEDFCPTT